MTVAYARTEWERALEAFQAATLCWLTNGSTAPRRAGTMLCFTPRTALFALEQVDEMDTDERPDCRCERGSEAAIPGPCSGTRRSLETPVGTRATPTGIGSLRPRARLWRSRARFQWRPDSAPS